jgi:hypothetical protein
MAFQGRGSVPHFSMRPHPALVISIILTLLVGVLFAMSFFYREDGTGMYKQRGILILIITGILTIFQLILATSKMWFPHLWKKNSTHARHKQHTQHHPAVKNRQYRSRMR